MSQSTFTTVHVVISLVAVALGVVALLRPSSAPKAWSVTTFFLATSLAASVTGLLFPSPRFGMGHAIGIVSLAVLAPTVLALCRQPLARAWRGTYVAGATVVLYLNAFIGVMQAFGKIGFLRALPSTAFASPLLLAHLLLVVVCLWLGIHALTGLQSGSAPRRVRSRPARPLYVVDRWGN